MLAELQKSMREALLDIDRPAPESLCPKRFEIYRRSVVLSLEQALGDAFPATEALVGRTWFRPAARAFARLTPPLVPQLSAYGEGFPEFLAINASSEQHPALLDLARFEWNRLCAYFAADAPGLDARRLLDVPAVLYPDVRFIFHPSARVWLLDRKEPTVCSVLAEVGGFPLSGEERSGVMVIRSSGGVSGTFLRYGEVKLLSALLIGATLAEASTFAQHARPQADEDLQEMLLRCIRLGLFSDFILPGGAMSTRY